MKQLKTDGLGFSYGGKKVLSGISAEIRSGEFTAITGPNGSGKTTLLKNLLTLLSPDEGTILLDSRDIRSFSRRELSRKAGSVPQNPSMDYDYTVEEAVLMGRFPHLSRFQSLSSADYAIARNAMEKADILGMKDQLVSRLSGGEAQRAAIARALTQEPDILALDEPTNHLDIRHQVEILSLLKNLCREKGLAVITVLHDLNFALGYADQVILLQDGNIHSAGKPEEVLNPDSIHSVYGVESTMEKDPFSGRPRILFQITPRE